MYKEFQQQVEHFYDAISFILEGQVVYTADPDQMGRVKVWVPSLDGENINLDAIPWAEYASPFFGYTVEYPAGGLPTPNTSHVAYGFWGIPKIGATVYVFCLNANPGRRVYFASSLRLQRNRSLPAGRNSDFNDYMGPWGDAGDGTGNLYPIQPAFDNLRQQFQNKLNAPQAISRGAVERTVAQAKNDKDGTDGYAVAAQDDTYLDPQTYCWVTPGHHAIIMQDDSAMAHIRIKTAEGHQVILDDSNERIYISTAKGESWVEMDLDGHIHIFGAQSISMRAGKDINMMADNNINIEAGKSINMKADGGNISLSSSVTTQIKAAGKIMLAACDNIDISGEQNINLTSTNDMQLVSKTFKSLSSEDTNFRSKNFNTTANVKTNILSSSDINVTGAKIKLNGPGQIQQADTAKSADCASEAGSPSVVPGHEPWTRPISPNPRGPNWKP